MGRGKTSIAGAVRAGNPMGSETLTRAVQDRLGPSGARLLKAAADYTTTEKELKTVSQRMARSAVKMMDEGMEAGAAVRTAISDLRATAGKAGKVFNPTAAVKAKTPAKAKAKAKKRPTKRPKR